MHSFWRFIIHLLPQFLKYQVLGFPLGLRSSDDSDPVEKKNFWVMVPLARPYMDKDMLLSDCHKATT